jgi:hypothetical protein
MVAIAAWKTGFLAIPKMKTGAPNWQGALSMWAEAIVGLRLWVRS